ncbi:MAG TPA: D-hexose-6-phosphate mutarotase [Burkholderiales bacterium]|nr:D-hexose-6-phosphate mutarotase [Burkholderiales bacterium]
MSTLDDLNHRFGITGTLHFEEAGDNFIAARVANPLGAATIALQGAHVMTYQPRGQQPLIWLSEQARFAPGKSIRGGVPVCWPWFGPHATESGFPGHGFARTVPWQLLETRALPDGRTQLVFEIIHNDVTRAQWLHPSRVRNVITVGQELEVELATVNTGAAVFELGQALHTYFHVGDIRSVTLHGLDGCDFIDKTDGGARRKQQGPVVFNRETDRIYLGTHGYCEIRDPAMNRSIVVTATGSRSTVVWNPWTEKAAKMGDFGAEGHLNMVCVETANAAEDVVTLRPGEEHVLAAQYRLLPR